MPAFRDKEEYEKWKAEKLKQSRERSQASGIPSSSPPLPPVKPPDTRGDAGPPGGEPEKPPPGNVSQGLSSIGDLFSNSWEIYKRRIATLIVPYLLAGFVFLVILGLFVGAGLLLSMVFPDRKAVFIGAFSFTGAIAGMMALFWGLAAVVFAVTDESLGIKEALGKGWQRVGAFIWFFSISGFIITGGFLLFFLPGVIFVVWFAFGQYILAADDERGIRALLKSREYVKGNWFDVFGRLFVIWFASMAVGVIPFLGPFLTLAFMPFMMIFVFLIYQDLKSMKGDVAYASSPGEKCKWIGVGALGYILVPIIIITLLGASLAVPFLLLKGMMSSKGQEFLLSPENWPGGTGMPSQPPPGKEPFPGQGQAVPQQPGESVSPFGQDRKGPDATGEAVVVKDGVREIYPLKTGFFSDTRFATPARATVQFQAPGPEHSNARRVEITLDATKPGIHYADGKLLSEQFMSEEKVKIGEWTQQGYQASFRWIADGGQIFWPTTSCTINITSPYTGNESGVFSGEVRDCPVHSAGIDYTISSFSFTVKGASQR